MMRATIDLIGMYNYDKAVLDLLVIPEQLDKDVLVDNLLMESAEQELIYNNVDFLKMAIGAWSKKQLHVWEELYDTTQYEYNPIWNKDGKITETHNLTLKEDSKENMDRVDNLTDKNTKDFKDKNIRDYLDKNTKDLKELESRNLTDETLNSTFGFNSNTEAPASKIESKGGGTDEVKNTGTDTIEHTGTDTIEHTGTDTIDHTGRQDIDKTLDKTTKDTGTITKLEQGNIGVTSTQSLIKEQREVVSYNVMDVIIHDFIDRFCLKVY